MKMSGRSRIAAFIRYEKYLLGIFSNMEIKLKIDKHLNVRAHTVDGVVTNEKIFAYLCGLYSSSNFDSSMNILWDLRNADLSHFSLSEVVTVRDFVEKNLSTKKALKVALVVARQIDLSLSTMLETLLDGSVISTKGFFNMADGEKWVAS